MAYYGYEMHIGAHRTWTLWPTMAMHCIQGHRCSTAAISDAVLCRALCEQSRLGPHLPVCHIKNARADSSELPLRASLGFLLEACDLHGTRCKALFDPIPPPLAGFIRGWKARICSCASPRLPSLSDFLCARPHLYMQAAQVHSLSKLGICLNSPKTGEGTVESCFRVSRHTSAKP